MHQLSHLDHKAARHPIFNNYYGTHRCGEDDDPPQVILHGSARQQHKLKSNLRGVLSCHHHQHYCHHRFSFTTCLRYATSTMSRISYDTACMMTRQRSAGSGSGEMAHASRFPWTKKTCKTRRSTSSGNLCCVSVSTDKCPCRSGQTARQAYKT